MCSTSDGADGPRGSVLVLGAGVSGLLAAARWPNAVVLERQPASTPPILWATFYSHRYIPKFAERPLTVRTRVAGSGGPAEYALKVYGDSGVPVSLSSVAPVAEMHEWDGRQLLSVADGRVRTECEVAHIDVSARKLVLRGGEQVWYDWLISTIPLPSLLRLIGAGEGVATFRSLPIFLRRRTAEPAAPAGEQWVTYWPGPEVAYYRTSQRGRQLTEEHLYPCPGPVIVLLPGKIFQHSVAAEWVKRLEGDRIISLGRYAEWKPKLLSHQTWERLQQLDL